MNKLDELYIKHMGMYAHNLLMNIMELVSI